jgi:hypothetical protein
MRRANKREDQCTADQAHNQNILGYTRTSERARREGEEREENIGGPAHDSQAGSRVPVSAMKEVQSADQSYRHTGTEEPEPEHGSRCRKPKCREHMQAAQGNDHPADEGVETIQYAHTLVFGSNEN